MNPTYYLGKLTQAKSLLIAAQLGQNHHRLLAVPSSNQNQKQLGQV